MSNYFVFTDEAGTYKRRPSETHIYKHPFYIRSNVLMSIDDYRQSQIDMQRISGEYEIPFWEEIKWSDLWTREKHPRNIVIASMTEKRLKGYYRRVFEKYKDKAEFIIRYFVIEGHDYARSAAIAVEAAAAQGYYWEMLNKTFENRGDWAYVNSEERLTQRLTEVFEEATSGKGDKERFVKDLSNENLAKKVDNDHSTGRKDSINATPTIIVDSADIEFSESELSIEELMAQRIEKALE